MDTNQISSTGMVLFFIASLVYLVLSFLLLYKIFKWRGKKAQRFCEQAKQDGRMVNARRDHCRLVTHRKDSRREYIADYSYTAPDGRLYKMKSRDCQRCSNIPPETIPLYLERSNYRKYYLQSSLNMGKHGAVLFLLSWVLVIAVYYCLVKHFVMPFF